MRILKGVNRHKGVGNQLLWYIWIFFFFALRFHPMAIFKMEVSMVIEEIYHRRGETGQNLLEILPQSTTESPASGLHTHDKRETEQVSFLANLAFWLLFAVSLTGLWALLYLSCLSGSVPSSTWSHALHFTHHTLLHSPPALRTLDGPPGTLDLQEDNTRAPLIFRWS